VKERISQNEVFVKVHNIIMYFCNLHVADVCMMLSDIRPYVCCSLDSMKLLSDSEIPIKPHQAVSSFGIGQFHQYS
jgi:hypothetical protein